MSGEIEEMKRRTLEDDMDDDEEEDDDDDDDEEDEDDDEHEGEVDEPKLKYERISNTLEAILNNDAASYLAVHTKVQQIRK